MSHRASLFCAMLCRTASQRNHKTSYILQISVVRICNTLRIMRHNMLITWNYMQERRLYCVTACCARHISFHSVLPDNDELGSYCTHSARAMQYYLLGEPVFQHDMPGHSTSSSVPLHSRCSLLLCCVALWSSILQAVLPCCAVRCMLAPASTACKCCRLQVLCCPGTEPPRALSSLVHPAETRSSWPRHSKHMVGGRRGRSFRLSLVPSHRPCCPTDT